MKKTIIIHCWEGYSDYCWYPDTKKQLEQKGFEVLVPEMPETELPTLQSWLHYLQKIVKQPDENTFLIGHSVGCITILRYLESLPLDVKIGGAVLVAGFSSDIGYEELTSFFQTPLNFQKIRSHCSQFVAIHSDNDPYVDLKYADIFKNELGAKIIIKHNAGHFSGEIEDEKSCTRLPEVAASIEKMCKS